MIPILKRFCDSFYMVLVDDKTLPVFLTEYVFNCPELITIEFQCITQLDGEVEIEFMKFPEGFAYLKDVESEFYEKAFALASKYYPEDEDCLLTPDVLLDMLITTFIDPIVNMYKDGNCIHIRTSPPEDVGYPEEFSTVGYLEMKHTQNSRFKGKRVYRSLMDLPHLCDEYCNHTPPPDNMDTSDNLREEDSSEVSSDIASNNMNASLDTSNLLVA
ncbi:hypothetical protein TNCV_2136251 [Trichonephila clavipes]|nr:hypothetical protein TNCV_2136251 [Trichonephila clavipes]